MLVLLIIAGIAVMMVLMLASMVHGYEIGVKDTENRWHAAVEKINYDKRMNEARNRYRY